jgi:Flp pilus assembly protein TadD
VIPFGQFWPPGGPAADNSEMRDSLKGEALRAALRHHRAGRAAHAEAGYKDLLTREPGNCDAMHLLGALYHQTGRHEAAAGLIAKATSLNPAEPAYYDTLGDVLIVLGRPEEALIAHARAYLLREDNPTAGRTRAKAG